jgi:hypothetical protein
MTIEGRVNLQAHQKDLAFFTAGSNNSEHPTTSNPDRTQQPNANNVMFRGN